MESSVSLQDSFSYAVWPVILTGGILAAVICYFVVTKIVKSRREKQRIQIKEIPALDIQGIKSRYLGELMKIQEEFDGENIDIRHAYQRMSRCSRGFVHAVTGIKVQNYTLQEIAALNIPPLYELVAEYYSPEFSRHSEGDVRRSLAKTRSLIETWQ